MNNNLNMNLTLYYEINYSDLENFFINYYNLKEFSIAADLETCNDIKKSFIVKKEKFDQYDLEKLIIFKLNGDGIYLTPLLLQDLCNDGIIQEGNYLINISW